MVTNQLVLVEVTVELVPTSSLLPVASHSIGLKRIGSRGKGKAVGLGV